MSQGDQPAQDQAKARSPYPMNEQQFEAACDYIFPSKAPLLMAISGIKNVPAYVRRLMIKNPEKATMLLAQVVAQSPNTSKLVFMWASKAVEPPNINISSVLSPTGAAIEAIPTNLRIGDKKPSLSPVSPYESRTPGGNNK